MEIVGEGNDGVVAKIIFPPDDRFPLFNCVKFYRQGVKPNTKILEVLKKIDAPGFRFAPYVVYPLNNINPYYTSVITKKIGALEPVVTLSPLYKKMDDPKRLTRSQYRHLRSSVDILTRNNIIHGDILGNVMLDTQTGTPILIDFDKSEITFDQVLLRAQNTTILTQFKAI